jgi:uncharacterized membrane protein
VETTSTPPAEAVARARGAAAVARLASAADALARVTVWQWGLVALVAGYTSYFTRTTLDVHHGLGTSAYDFGLYDQGVWLLSRFRSPFVTLMGRNLFGDHTSFVLVLLVPLYWIAPRPIASDCANRRAPALAACYLLHPAVGWTNRENFHPDSFIAVFVGMAIYAAVERRWRTYAVFVALALLVKEDASLVLVPLGVWVALKRDRRIGLVSIAASLAFMAVAMLVVMRSLIGVPTRNAWRVPFGGPGGFLRRAVTRPQDVVRHYASDGRPWYLWQMAVPFAWVFLAAPGVALISALVLATNMLSTFWYQYQIEYHYALVAVPALAMGTVWAISTLRERWRAVVVGVVMASSLWSGFSRTDALTWAPDHPVAIAARDIIRDLPGDAVVSAQYSVVAHIARREEVYMFPNPFAAELYGPDDSLAGQRLPAADRVEWVVLPVTLDPPGAARWDAVAHEFELVRANGWWRLYRRASGSVSAP